MIQTKEFLNLVKTKIIETAKNDYSYNEELEIIQVWYCKTIQNHKGLFIIKDSYDRITPFFIEATYNGDASELYLDFYTKKNKKTYKGA